MAKKTKSRPAAKRRNPIARSLRDPRFHLRQKPTKKRYQRTAKHRGRETGLDVVFEDAIGAADQMLWSHH